MSDTLKRIQKYRGYPNPPLAGPLTISLMVDAFAFIERFDIRVEKIVGSGLLHELIRQTKEAGVYSESKPTGNLWGADFEFADVSDKKIYLLGELASEEKTFINEHCTISCIDTERTSKVIQQNTIAFLKTSEGQALELAWEKSCHPMELICQDCVPKNESCWEPLLGKGHCQRCGKIAPWFGDMGGKSNDS